MSNSDDYEARYAEIMARIENRHTAVVKTREQLTLASILDGLNAMGVLDDARKKRLKPFSVFGPKALRGRVESADGMQSWAAGLIWFKPRGYHFYRTLTLTGIWAVECGADARIIIGSKTLEFDAPVFNPESYNREIKRGFELYYGGDGTPPPESDHHFSCLYNPGERLTARKAVESALIAWAADLCARHS
jgi:hypothetical protein